MNDLIKVAQYGTRLEKIAAVIDQLAYANSESEASEVLELGAEMGIAPEEIEQAIPLFKTASDVAGDPVEELVKVASAVVDDPQATPLEKVAAIVDGTVAGAFDPEAAYEAAAELGFAPDDVDFIYESAYLNKEAADAPKEPGFLAKMKSRAGNAFKAKELRQGYNENDLRKFLKGAGKTGLGYGAPITAATAAGAYAYEHNKNKKSR